MQRLIAFLCCFVLLACKDNVPLKTNLLIATSNGDMYNIDLVKNQLLWRVAGNKNTDELTFFTLRGNTILRAYSDKRVIEIDRDTGKVNWTYDDAISPNHSAYGYDFKGVAHYLFNQYPVVQDNALIFGNSMGEVKSIDLKTRAINWTHQAAQPIYSSPILVDGKLLVNENSYLEFVDPANGRKLTRLAFDRPLTQQPVLDGQAVYVIDEDGTVFCLSTDLGLIWKFKAESVRSIQAVGVSDVYVSGEKLQALDKKTGELRWAISMPKQQTKQSVETTKDNSVYVVQAKSDAVQGVQEVDGELTVNTAHYLVKLKAKNGSVVRQHYFATREIIGTSTQYKGQHYYLASDGAVYTMDSNFEKESVVSKAIAYQTERKLDDSYMVLY